MKKLILIFCAIILLATQGAIAQSTSAKNAFDRGIAAYNNEKYVEAFPDLKQAAMAGVPEAFNPLIHLYANGDYDGSGIGNYKEAFKWTLMAMNKYIDEGANNRELAVTSLMYYDPLCFLTGDYQETVDHAVPGLEKGSLPRMPSLTNQIAASYLKLGNTSKAIEWANQSITLSKERNDDISLHTAYAILAKISFDKNDYNRAIELSKSAASEGKIPLAAYVYGASLIKANNRPDIGKLWAKAAAEYDYSGVFEINCFEDEIQRYWRSIMNRTF